MKWMSMKTSSSFFILPYFWEKKTSFLLVCLANLVVSLNLQSQETELADPFGLKTVLNVRENNIKKNED